MSVKIGIIGDLIIDKFNYFKSVRLSPEGPAPVVNQISNSIAPGGSGNIATSLSNLGLNTNFYFNLSSEESDSTKKTIKEIFKNSSLKLNPKIGKNKLRIPIKVRYYVDSHYFMRDDIEEKNQNNHSEFNLEYIDQILTNNDLIVVSDYQKGFINTNSLQKIISKCSEKNVPLFIDTKNRKSDAIINAFCLKINRSEFDTLFENDKYISEENIEDLKKLIDIKRKKAKIQNLVVTVGSKGSILANDKGIFHAPASVVEVIDLTGAGDAFLAALVYSFITKFKDKNKIVCDDLNLQDIAFGNKAAETVVCRKGTVPISKDFINSNSSKKLKIGFTNGCFDVLHTGHLSLLRQARLNCDYLVVGLNSDLSIKKLKGECRPINNQSDRLEMLNSLSFVDEVRIFSEETPIELIKKISPDVLIKGADYSEEEIIGADYVRSYGGRVLRIELIPNKSTTEIIKKIKKIN